MKTSAFFLILVLFISTTTNAASANSKSKSDQDDKIESYTPSADDAVNVSEISQVKVVHELPATKVHLGVIGQSFVYREPDVDIKDSGRLTGLEASIQFAVYPDVLLRGNMQFLTGNLKYDGHLMNSNAAYESNNDYKVREFKADASIKTDLSEENDVYFYAGLGRKETLQANNPSEKSDYARDIIYNYYSLGTYIDVVVNDQTTVVFDFGIETLFSGGVNTHLSDWNPAYDDVYFKFASGGSSLGGDISLQYKLTSSDVITAKIGIRRWNVAESESVYSKADGKYYYEPKNTTQITTLGVGYLF